MQVIEKCNCFETRSLGQMFSKLSVTLRNWGKFCLFVSLDISCSTDIHTGNMAIMPQSRNIFSLN